MERRVPGLRASFARVAAAALATVLCAGCGGGGGGGTSASPAADPDAGLTRLEVIGKRIFFDTTLSNPPGQSCAGCHDAATAFAGNFGSTEGVPFAADRATLGLRNTPTAMYASFTPAFGMVTVNGHLVASGGQFLDGRAATLEDQARMPFLAAGEMNLVDANQLADRLARSPYALLMAKEFGLEVFSHPGWAMDAAVSAIAAFERTAEFAPFSSKFDNSRYGAATLSELEKEGQRLFADPNKGNCSNCHAFKADATRASELLFTDFSYHNIGVPRNMRIPANGDAAFFDLGLCGPRRTAVADESLCGAFKVPTLRNVNRKRAFMHNGFFTSLRDVVAFYASRDSTPTRWYVYGTQFDDVPARFRANIDLALVPFQPAAAMPVRLDEHEIDAITAFLRTLDDGFGASRVPGSR